MMFYFTVYFRSFNGKNVYTKTLSNCLNNYA